MPTKETPAVDIAKRDRVLAMQNAPAWRPEKGEILTARLVDLRKGGENGDYGVYPILVMESVDGFPFPSGPENTTSHNEFVAVHAFHTIIRDRLAEIRPRPVDKPVLTIMYGGQVQFGTYADGKDGKSIYVPDPAYNDYHNYTVIVGDGSDVNTETFDWDTDVPASKEK